MNKKLSIRSGNSSSSLRISLVSNVISLDIESEIYARILIGNNGFSVY